MAGAIEKAQPEADIGVFAGMGGMIHDAYFTIKNYRA
jgi:hypothetical protein